MGSVQRHRSAGRSHGRVRREQAETHRRAGPGRWSDLQSGQQVPGSSSRRLRWVSSDTLGLRRGFRARAKIHWQKHGPAIRRPLALLLQNPPPAVDLRPRDLAALCDLHHGGTADARLQRDLDRFVIAPPPAPLSAARPRHGAATPNPRPGSAGRESEAGGHEESSRSRVPHSGAGATCWPGSDEPWPLDRPPERTADVAILS